MNPNDFYAQYKPYAQIVQGKTGINANTVLAWWSWESDFATNQGSKFNNLAGINYHPTADGRIPNTSYASYNSLDAFANDYARVLSVNGYGYPEVLKADQSNVAEVTQALNASQYAVGDYNVDTIVARAKAAAAVNGGSLPQKNDSPTSGIVGGGDSFGSLDAVIAREAEVSSFVLDANPVIAELQEKSKTVYIATGLWTTAYQQQLHVQADAIRNHTNA